MEERSLDIVAVDRLPHRLPLLERSLCIMLTDLPPSPLLLTQSAKKKSPAKKKTVATDEKSVARRSAADQRKALKPLRDEIARWEREADRLRGIIDVIDKGLAAPGLYQKDPKTATDLQIKRAKAVELLDTAEMSWLEAEEKLEAAQAGLVENPIGAIHQAAACKVEPQVSKVQHRDPSSRL